MNINHLISSWQHLPCFLLISWTAQMNQVRHTSRQMKRKAVSLYLTLENDLNTSLTDKYTPSQELDTQARVQARGRAGLGESSRILKKSGL
jgi:hypothetical protein